MILYITHQEADYGGALLYSGLCHSFGWDTVYDYPIKESYHGRVHQHPEMLNIWQSTTAPFPWARAFPYAYPDTLLPANSPPEALCWFVKTMLHNGFFDLVVIESLRPQALASIEELGLNNGNPPCPVIIHDGEDAHWFNAHPDVIGYAIRLKAQVILKREFDKRHAPFVYEKQHNLFILPYPFSFPTHMLGRIRGLNNTYDIAYLAGETHPDRAFVQRALSSVEGIAALNGKRVVTRDANMGYHFDWNDYMGIYSNSRVGVSVRGSGFDTLRYWEIAASTMLCSQKPTIHIPNAFTHLVDCVEFELPDLYTAFTDEVMSNCRDIMNRGREHLINCHTDVARVNYLRSHLSDWGIGLNI